jgi:hypothetical protein
MITTSVRGNNKTSKVTEQTRIKNVHEQQRGNEVKALAVSENRIAQRVPSTALTLLCDPTENGKRTDREAKELP